MITNAAIRLGLAMSLLVEFTLPAQAQPISDYGFQVSASVQTDPPQVTLFWPVVPGMTGYLVYRKGKDDTTWGSPASVAGSAAGYIDQNVTVGIPYEYQVLRTSTNYDSYAYLYSGIQLPLVESRGKVILIVDQSVSSVLAPDLAQLRRDLVGDGWKVVRHDVPRMVANPADPDPQLWAVRSNEVATVKALIKAEYLADRAEVKAVLLFGHVPVPYSGSEAPDQHADHRGAWPADVFYGDMTGTWTDSSIDITQALDRRNHNVPGDGKFDQIYTPSEVVLEVGRIDMANLPALPLTEGELLRRYVNKNHQYRQKLIAIQPRALIDDNFGLLNREVPAVNGWNNFAPLVGANNVIAGRWLTDLSAGDYLWAYGAGAGTFTSAVGVVETRHFLVYDTRVVFAMLFGSYFGDWDSENNLLRAQLGMPSYTVATLWGGRPDWYVHHMAMGETIGFSTRLSQKNMGLYQAHLKMNGIFVGLPTDADTNGVHMALMGDPTLRLHPVAPAASFMALTNTSGGVDLTWTPSPDSVLGYYVYRAPGPDGPYVRLTSAPLGGTSYADVVLSSDRYYMIRAIKLETSSSGTYYNGSQAAFAEVPSRLVATDANSWSGGGGGIWKISDATGTAGAAPGWDLVQIDGTLNVSATSSQQFTIQVVSDPGPDLSGPPAHFSPDESYTWPILTASDSVQGFAESKLDLETGAFQGDLGGGRFNVALTDDAKTVNLVFTPNHAPVTKPAVFNRAWDTVLRVRIDDLLARFTSDPDGDARALVHVGSSTNGTIITSTGTFLNFAPANNFAETITYYVQDVREYRPGDTVRIVPGSLTIQPLPEALQFTAHHAIEIEWKGEVGKMYQVQSRLESETDWKDLGEPFRGTGEATSLFERTDGGAKFYRIISLQ